MAILAEVVGGILFMILLEIGRSKRMTKKEEEELMHKNEDKYVPTGSTLKKGVDLHKK